MTAAAAPQPAVTLANIEVTNPSQTARSAETLTIALPELDKLGVAPKQIVVFDAAGKALVSQLVDNDGDEVMDELLFQTDLEPNQKKQFAIRFGKRELAARDAYKVYGRFVRERHDDFAWENDRIARRMYGVGLESWPADPLVSSGIDSWSKRTARLVINDWYLTDDYHHDNGEGADMYSVGKSRGCGGLGVWSGDALHVSRNFVQSRVLANGPLRLIFELDYPEWSAGALRVAETKRIQLDAGSNFERHESRFRVTPRQAALQVGLGIAKHKGSDTSADPSGHWLRSWEPQADGSHLGCGVVLPPQATGTSKEIATDYLYVTPVEPGGKLVYYTGFGWDRASSGAMADAAVWQSAVQGLANELAKPAHVELTPGSAAMPWSTRACTSALLDDSKQVGDAWNPAAGFLLTSCLRAAARHHDAALLTRVKQVAERWLAPPAPEKLAEQNLGELSLGNLWVELYEHSEPPERERYDTALRALRTRLQAQPRTANGGFAQSRLHPQQMWLDGAATVAPWLAHYARISGEATLYDEAAQQLEVLERHTRDPKTGLLYHGWDASKQEPWANKQTGTSPVFWARGAGWYALALVDVLEQLPDDHKQRPALRASLNRLATALAAVQDPQTGTFWQVLDAPKRDKNYREASATAMVAYALRKAEKAGWLSDAKLAKVASAAQRGTLEQFVEVDPRGQLSLTQSSKIAGPGEASYDYYTNSGSITDDPTGLGAFVLASLERE